MRFIGHQRTLFAEDGEQHFLGGAFLTRDHTDRLDALDAKGFNQGLCHGEFGVSCSAGREVISVKISVVSGIANRSKIFLPRQR
jgi:hypothetical protein